MLTGRLEHPNVTRSHDLNAHDGEVAARVQHGSTHGEPRALPRTRKPCSDVRQAHRRGHGNARGVRGKPEQYAAVHLADAIAEMRAYRHRQGRPAIAALRHAAPEMLDEWMFRIRNSTCTMEAP
jgi:hypothetical protein